MPNILALLIIFGFASKVDSFLQPTATCTDCPACQNAAGCPVDNAAPAAAPKTAEPAAAAVAVLPAGLIATEAPAVTEAVVVEVEPTTLDYYSQYWQAQGWKTDDAGNVYVGDDTSKLLLIQMGSYCPEALCKGWFGIW